MSWTEERVDELKRLWEQGHSASQIAAILGDVTRNAVIGKAHRLDLSSRPSPIRGGGEGRRKPAAKPAGKPAPRPKRKPAPKPAAKAPPHRGGVGVTTAKAPAPGASRPKPAPADYKGPTCQWPIGDPGAPDFHFCAAIATPGRPYCEPHCAVAYRRREDAA